MSNLFPSETPENQQTTAPEGASHQAPNDPYTTLLASIKNERGEQKYRSVEEALKGLQHAQSYIPEVKTELNQTKAELEQIRQALKKQEELERLVNDVASRQSKQELPSQVLDESKLAELVDSRLSAVEQQRIAQANQITVRDSLIKSFGDKAADVFNSKATDLGMTPEELTALAARSPKAVLSMLGVNGSDAHKQSTQAPSSSTINTAVLPQRNSLLADKQAFMLKPGATTRDVAEMVDRSAALMQELQERDGVSIHDLTNPTTFFKYFG